MIKRTKEVFNNLWSLLKFTCVWHWHLKFQLQKEIDDIQELDELFGFMRKTCSSVFNTRGKKEFFEGLFFDMIAKAEKRIKSK